MLLILIAIAAVFYSLLNLTIVKAGGKIDAALNTFIYNSFGALIALTVWLVSRGLHKNAVTPTTGTGIILSLAGGAALSIFALALFKAFERGGAAYTMPVVYGGAIVLVSLVSWLFFKERVNAMQAAGIVTIILGIGLVVASKLKTA